MRGLSQTRYERCVFLSNRRYSAKDIRAGAPYMLDPKGKPPRGLAYLEAYLFANASTASATLRVLRARYRLATDDPAVMGEKISVIVGRHSLRVSALGDEAPRGISFDLGGKGVASGRLLTYFWRRHNVVAIVAANDVLGDFDQRSVLNLARRIDRRAAN